MNTTNEDLKDADGIVSYLFDDYPDNNQVRRDAIVEVASRIASMRAAEREKAAKVAENAEPPEYEHSAMEAGWNDATVNIAELIRAGDKESDEAIRADNDARRDAQGQY